MKVEEVMKHAASSCSPDTALSEVADRLTEIGCGMLAVVTRAGRVLGVVSDRDVCRVVAHAAPGFDFSALRARDAMTPSPAVVARHEDIGVALARMRAQRLRRLPVTDGEGRLEGLLSLDEIVASSLPLGSDENQDLMRTLRALGTAAQHRT
jgi:CBS domain-containing protein